MKELTIGITTYNNDPFISILLYEIKEQVKRHPEILQYIDFWLYDDNSYKTDYVKEIPDYFQVELSNRNSKTPSTGRNYIINKAKSNYILFIDGDDILVRDLTCLVKELNQKQGDLLFSSVVKIGADGQLVETPFVYSELLYDNSTSQEVIEKVCAHQTGIWSIYKLDFIRDNDLKYESYMRYEDNFFLYNMLLANPQIGIIKKPYYGWRTNYKSFSYSKGTYKHRVTLYKNTLALLKENSENTYSPYILFSVWNQTYSNIIRNYSKLSNKSTKKYFKSLNQLTEKNIDLVRRLKENADDCYVDSYFKFTKRKIFRSYPFIYCLKKINKVRLSTENNKKNLMKVFCLLPINEKKIFMTSQYGQFGSNPKYLYLKLKNENSSKQIKYFVKDQKLIDGKEFLDYNNKLLYYYHLYTSSKVYFDTWVEPTLKKRKNQKWIQMWHGYPYKRVYTDIEIYTKVNSRLKHEKKSSSVKKWDQIYSLDAKNSEIFKMLFPHSKVVEKEYERIEWLIEHKDDEVLKRNIRKKYNLGDGAITLFAPTYRPYKVYFDEKQVKKLAKPGNQVIYNPHPMLNTNYKHDGITLNDIDIQEILLVCDEIITDYSSIQYDFLKAYPDSAIKYYQPDLELYINNHGLYDHI